MNLKEIKEVIQLMNENGLSEIDIEKDGLKVRLKKSMGGSVEQSIVYESRPSHNVARSSDAGYAPAAATGSGRLQGQYQISNGGHFLCSRCS